MAAALWGISPGPVGAQNPDGAGERRGASPAETGSQGLESEVERLRRLAADAPDDVHAAREHADALRKLLRLEDAENEYRRAMALDPQDLEVRVQLAALLESVGREREAADLLNQLQEEAPLHFGVRAGLERLAIRRQIRLGPLEPAPDSPEAVVHTIIETVQRGDGETLVEDLLHPELAKLLDRPGRRNRAATAEALIAGLRRGLEHELSNATGYLIQTDGEPAKGERVAVWVLVEGTPSPAQIEKWRIDRHTKFRDRMPFHVREVAPGLSDAGFDRFAERLTAQKLSTLARFTVELWTHEDQLRLAGAWVGPYRQPRFSTGGLLATLPPYSTDADVVRHAAGEPDPGPLQVPTWLLVVGSAGLLGAVFYFAARSGGRRRSRR